ncbi:MAG TPA: hypothetical protein V6C81_05105 [Planktothrix sp.]|jgi:hypothetical protein
MQQTFAKCFLCDRTYCSQVDGQKLLYPARQAGAFICLWCIERCHNGLAADNRMRSTIERAVLKEIVSKLTKNESCSFCGETFDAGASPGLRASLIGSILGRNDSRVCPLCIRRFYLNMTLIGKDTVKELFTKNVIKKLQSDCTLLSILVEVVQAETREPCATHTIAPLSAVHLLAFQRLTWMIDRHGETLVATFMIDVLSGLPERDLKSRYPQMMRDYRKYKSKIPISETSVDQAFSNHLDVGEQLARDQFWASLLKAERTHSSDNSAG